MKEYVLDLAPPPPTERVAEPELMPPPARSYRRSIVLVIVLGALALAFSYAALIGFFGASQASIETAAASGPTFASATPTQAQAQAQTQTQARTQAQHANMQPAQADVVEQEAEVAPSRITREHGRYLIELHSTAIGPALDMLTKATGATVHGSDVLAGNAARITRTVATDSALEAWQAVFGGVANFAATCSHGACAVRFVPSVAPSPATMMARTPPPAAIVQAADEPQPD